MANDRIKVAGYAKKVTLEENIEYRNFSPDLVGVQLAGSGGASLFTIGNFSITTNVEPKISKTFRTNSFSNFVTLADLDLNVQSTLELLRNNFGVILNLDKRKLSNYALFNSFREFVRVSLENIISNWPAAIYVQPTFQIPPDFNTQVGPTVINYNYNSLTQKANFLVNVNNFTNQYSINYLRNGDLSNSFNQNNQLRNLVLSYADYSISVNGQEYEITNFVGSDFELNSYVSIETNGDPFSSSTTSIFLPFYIKPNKTKENEFFNSLPDFEYYLLNRLTIPKYTAVFDSSVITNEGIIVEVVRTITWPTSDGYNLDFETDEYTDYATELLEISDNFDLSTSNLMVRFLVSESITDFDTTAVSLSELDRETADQKVNKTLTIYGAEYDEINKFITGIKFANTVSYNKLNNTPDIYLKNIAKVLGWELISSVLENNLLKSYVIPKDSTYLGQSVGLTAVEADIELWRRLILNSPWIWKSKGTRNAIEFLFKFIGTPLGLIQFNEYIYLAENKIDLDLFRELLQANNLSVDLGLYPISVSGYPQAFPNTSNLYFQGKGLWYRETGGPNSTIDITTGNNPHVGPYDAGYYYINQFRGLIPNFSATTINRRTETTNTTNIFTNYNLGTMTNYSGLTYVNLTKDDGSDFSNVYVVDSSIILDPKNRKDESFCGCQTDDMLKSLSVCIDKKQITAVNECENLGDFGESEDFTHYIYGPTLYDINGNPTPSGYETIFVNTGCCKTKQSVYYNEVFNDGTSLGPFTLLNSGYICCSSSPKSEKHGDCGCFVTCNWSISTPRTVDISGNTYLVFNDELGVIRTSSYNGCNCLAEYTTPISIRDPYTNELGYACQLTARGKADINLSDSIIVKTYEERVKGKIGCNEVLPEPDPALPPKMFLVIVNDPNQIGKRTNVISYGQNSNPPIGGDFAAYTTTLSASSASGPQIGYMYGFTPRLPVNTPSYNDNISILVATGTSQNNATIAFDKTKNRLGYLISTNIYDNTTILSQLPNFNDITAGITQTGITSTYGTYESSFLLTNVGTPTNVYLLVDYRDLTPPEPPTPTITLCHEIQNFNFEAKTFNYRDVNNELKENESIEGFGRRFVCAVQGSVTGTDVEIVPSTTVCSNDEQCALTPITPNFIVINNSSTNTIEDVTANGTRLPSGTSNLYPVAPGRTLSRVRQINTVTSRITVTVIAPINSNIKLFKGSSLIDEISITTGSAGQQINVTFDQRVFNPADIIRIVFSDSIDGGEDPEPTPP